MLDTIKRYAKYRNEVVGIAKLKFIGKRLSDRADKFYRSRLLQPSDKDKEELLDMCQKLQGELVVALKNKEKSEKLNRYYETLKGFYFNDYTSCISFGVLIMNLSEQLKFDSKYKYKNTFSLSNGTHFTLLEYCTIILLILITLFVILPLISMFLVWFF